MKKSISKGFESESPKKEFKINFKNGQSSFVDEKTMQYILHLQNTIKNKKSIPKFYDLNLLLNSIDNKLLDFYTFIFNNKNFSHSQLFQDLFVLYFSGMKKKARI